MNEAVDPVTGALTGQLPLYLLLAAALTWPVALGLLRLYTRAVRRSMRTTKDGSGVPDAARPVLASGSVQAHQANSQSTTLHDLPESSLSVEAADLFARLKARPTYAAAVYAIGGCVYGRVITAALFAAGGLEFLPLRFAIISWIHA